MVTENFDSNQGANSVRASKNECISCENYKRKVKEVENTVSGRDVLIQMLQREIKKVEDLYKNSIDEYEKLRFLHCTTVQELSNLKEIHRKLEADNDKLTRERDLLKNNKSQLEHLQNEVETWKNKSKELEKYQCPATIIGKGSELKENSSSNKNILKEVINIEKIIQSQNQSVKDLLGKLLNEVKYSKDNKENLDGIEEQLRKSLQAHRDSHDNSGSKKELLETIDEQGRQIDDLKNIVTKLKEENIAIKNQITEKKSCLSTCLSVLDKSHTDINNLSESIETIVKEKEKLLKEIENLKNIIDQNRIQLNAKEQEICELKCKLDFKTNENNDDKLFKENVDLMIELTQCKKNCEKLQKEFSRKNSEIKEIEENNNVLGETLVIVTDENRSNLKKIADLNKSITDVNREYTKCVCDLQMKIAELEKELETYKNQLKSYEINPLDKEVASIKQENNYISQQTQSGIETKNAYTDADKKYINDIEQLGERVHSLEGQLKEATAENTEYEEENKYYCQKIDTLLSQLHIVEEEKYKNEESSIDCCKKIDLLKQQYDIISKQKDNEIKSLKEEINELQKLQQNFVNTGKKNEELKNKIALVENDIKIARDEKLALENENQKLNNEITNLQMEVSKFHKQIESEILQLQNKLDSLEKQNIQKTEELSNCCHLMKNIKENVTDQKAICEQYLLQIKELEAEKASLEQQLVELNSERKNSLKEIKSLKDKNLEYEKSFQECQCSEVVEQFEKTIDDLQCNNEKLKIENKTVATEVCQKQCMINHLEQCIEKSKKILEECEKQMKEMHDENDNLKKDNDLLKTNLEKYVYEAEVNKAVKTNLQEKLSQIQRQNQQLHSEKADLSKRLEEKDNTAENLSHLEQEYDKLLQDNQRKDGELENLRGKLESSALTCRTANEEYEKLKRAYKDIKVLLSQQLKKYNAENQTSPEDNNDNRMSCASEVRSRPCLEKYIEGLELRVQEKDTKINFLQEKNMDLNHKLNQIDDYVQKLISENKNLKIATQHLINNLVHKLKELTENFDDPSAESIASEIFHSLTELEKQIIPTMNSGVSSSSMEKCNCMSIIMSKYKIDKNDPVLKDLVACKLKCKKGIKDVKKYDDMVIGSSSEIINICEDCCGQVSESNTRKTPPESKSYCTCGEEHGTGA